MFHDFEKVIILAKRYLLEQAEQQFGEACHTMYFPRWAGFKVKAEKQSSDIFARAVLANILLDIAVLDDDEHFKAALAGIVRREARYVAEAKLPGRAGGWSYFPNLPELPPDVDSLAAALFLFTRAAPEFIPLCQEPINLALGSLLADGSLETWIIAPDDDREQRQLMEKGVRFFWGERPDVDVCAHFYLALLVCDPQAYGEIVRRGGQYLLAKQLSNGVWQGTWYTGHAYVTGLCLRLLQKLDIADAANADALRFFLASQRQEGGWGSWETDPLETALVISTLSNAGIKEHPDVIARAVAYLIDRQTWSGYWNSGGWIKMEIGRPRGRVSKVLTYDSTTLTTAFCLRSLLWVRSSGSVSKLDGLLPK